MDHSRHAATQPIKTSSDRAFGLVFTAFFLFVGLWPLLHGQAWRLWALILAAGFALVSLTRPAWLAPLNQQWTRLGLLLHKIVNPIVLGLIFLLSIVPISLLFRLLGKDPLRLKRKPDATSYWIPRQPPGPAPDSLPRQF